MGTLNQSITLVSNTFGKIELPVLSCGMYGNTFYIGDKVLNFEALFPNEDLAEKDFSMYIYEGVKNLVEIHLGNELKYGIFSIPHSTRVYVEKL